MVGRQVFAEILDGLHLVIRQGKEDLLSFLQFPIRLNGAALPLFLESHAPTGFHGQVHFSPIDAHIVPRAVEDFLHTAGQSSGGKARAHGLPILHRILARVVQAQRFIGHKGDGAGGQRPAVPSLGGNGNVGDGSCQQLQVVQQQRGCEL